MEYLKVFLTPLLSEKSVWLSVAGSAVAWANNKWQLGFNPEVVNALAGAMVTWTLVHVAHINTVGKEDQK